MSNLNTALVHYPVINKHGETVTTSVTLFDLHDIARSSVTFGMNSFYVVNHALKQHNVVKRVTNFWDHGFGKQYNSNRKEAFDIVKTVKFWEEARQDIERRTGQPVITIGTSARQFKNSTSVKEAKEIIQEHPVLILFGTGWGLSKEITDTVDFMLDPIYGPTNYNHLSVRSAVAIILYELTK
ncbi:MAG: RNA methyltransferase [Caldisericia bacterium]|nr:RNA methyltransferase [Caldisericia bacterium]